MGLPNSGQLNEDALTVNLKIVVSFADRGRAPAPPNQLQIPHELRSFVMTRL